MDSSASRRVDQAKKLASVVSAFGDNSPSPADKGILMECLFDTWSEIRCDSAKYLKMNKPTFSKYVVQELFYLFLHTVESGPASGCDEVAWQKVHGAMLALNALMQGEVDILIMERMRKVCIELQGYSRLPVREEVRKCLLKLFLLHRREEEQVQVIKLILDSISVYLRKKQQPSKADQASQEMGPVAVSGGEIFTFNDTNLPSEGHSSPGPWSKGTRLADTCGVCGLYLFDMATTISNTEWCM